VNLVLFEPNEIGAPLPLQDPRASHILDVLRRKPGDLFDIGLINGPRGKASVVEVGSISLTLTFSWSDTPPPLSPLTLLIGLPRPQTARKILQETAALGVSALHFITSERGEPSYASSTLWSSGEWRRHVRDGAAQAFCTRLPDVSFGHSFCETLPKLSKDTLRIALDNYEASSALEAMLKHLAQPSSVTKSEKHIVLAIGSERGWASTERAALRKNDFALAHLGSRVLRTETAVVAAVAIVKSSLGWL